MPRTQTPASRLASSLVTCRLDSIPSWRERGHNHLLEYPVAWPVIAVVDVHPRRTAVAFAAMQLPCRKTPPCWLLARAVMTRLQTPRPRRLTGRDRPIAGPVVSRMYRNPRRRVVTLGSVGIPCAQTPTGRLVASCVSCSLQTVRAGSFAGNNVPIARPMIATMNRDPR